MACCDFKGLWPLLFCDLCQLSHHRSPNSPLFKVTSNVQNGFTLWFPYQRNPKASRKMLIEAWNRKKYLFFLCPHFVQLSIMTGGLGLHRKVSALSCLYESRSPNTHLILILLNISYLWEGTLKITFLTHLTSARHAGDTTKCILGSHGCQFYTRLWSLQIIPLQTRIQNLSGKPQGKVEKAQGGLKKLTWPNFQEREWQSQTDSDWVHISSASSCLVDSE